MRQTGNRFRNTVAIALLALAGVAVSVATEQQVVKALIGIPALLLSVKLIGLVFSAGVGVFSYHRSEVRHLESSAANARERAAGHLKDMLASAIESIFRAEKPQNVRANIMAAEGDELRMLASINMDVFPDFRVRLRKGQGCAGVAWERAVSGPASEFWRPVYATRAQLRGKMVRTQWGLTGDQASRTRHILWIASFPLFLKSGESRVFVGVLNFDGVHEPLAYPKRLTEPDFVGECISFGDNVVEVAAEAGLWRQGVDSGR